MTSWGLELSTAGRPYAARPWSAIASNAAHCGAPALVPPIVIQP
jgi:hypothetical protein